MPFVNNNGVKIHYEAEGERSSPPLLMHHGFSSSIDSWYENGFVRGLKDNYRLIMIDARGHGKSDKPHDPKAYESAIIVRDLTSILDDLKIQKTNYYGYSYGARVGMQFARLAMPRLNSLILGGTNPSNINGEASRQRIKVYEEMERNPNLSMADMVAILEASNGQMTPEQKVRVMQNDVQALTACGKAFYTWPDTLAVLPKLTIPCLIMDGETDRYYPSVKESVAIMPNTTLVTFPGLNHSQVSRSSEVVLPYMKEFLKTVNNTLK
jgi:pimeloyl-ACP methyl ester carboxylesterase